MSALGGIADDHVFTGLRQHEVVRKGHGADVVDGELHLLARLGAEFDLVPHHGIGWTWFEFDLDHGCILSKCCDTGEG